MNNWFESLIVTILLFTIFFTLIDWNNPLTYFKPYRKWRGGRWAKVSSLIPFVSKKWVKVNNECVERVDEDYRPKRKSLTTDDLKLDCYYWITTDYNKATLEAFDKVYWEPACYMGFSQVYGGNFHNKEFAHVFAISGDSDFQAVDIKFVHSEIEGPSDVK